MHHDKLSQWKQTVYPIWTTGLVWLCFKSHSTIICTVNPPSKCPILLFFLTTIGRERHLTQTEKHIFTPSAIVRACAYLLKMIQMSHFRDEWLTSESQVGTSPLPLIVGWHRKSGEWTERALPRHIGLWEMGSLGLGSLLHTVLLHNHIVILIQCLIQLFPSGQTQPTIVHKQLYIKIMLIK